jgi:hypothetical protein
LTCPREVISIIPQLDKSLVRKKRIFRKALSYVTFIRCTEPSRLIVYNKKKRHEHDIDQKDEQNTTIKLMNSFKEKYYIHCP